MKRIHSDLALARRLESNDATANREAVRAAARRCPESGASAEPFMGGWAMYDGPLSPLTQCFALGLNGGVEEKELDALEEFFRRRGAPCNIELCAHADASLVALLGKRGYRPLEFSNVLVRDMPPEPLPPQPAGIEIRRVTPPELPLFAKVIGEGFFGAVTPPGLESFFSGAFSEMTGGHSYLAWVEGKAAGGGGMSVYDGVLNSFGDATLEAYRGRGIQSALIAVRLAAGVAAGAELALATTMPGTVSQRNYERFGYRVAYSRCKFTRDLA